MSGTFEQAVRVKVSDSKITADKPMSGKDSEGNLFGVNNKYFTKNGAPLIPVMGEFHFSRYPENEWRQSLLKMKAGGVDIVSCYIFWIHHEEIKGEFDFTGCRNVRKFMETANEVGMKVWLRIGPWAHGECRNGGFPDWLVSELGHNGLGKVKDFQGELHYARTNDSLYMKYVERFWRRLFEEVSGCFVKDGGAILGVQLENEYCHAGGAPTRAMGFEHMVSLKKLALEIGYIAPYYTATAWGGAIVIEDETIPVLGGYVDAPWSSSTEELAPSENFLFIPFHNDENVGSDLAVGQNSTTFSADKNPYLTAELGGGLQVTHHRRTYPYPEDIEAQALCMLGSGANLLGYYMYHGGVNPDAKLSTLQESKASGYYNDLPEKCYDFATCIRESGKCAESYHRLKKLHSFMHSFSEELSEADCFLPDIKPQGPSDLETPRVSVRYNKLLDCGFIFVNNHQRKRQMKDIKNLTVIVEGPKFTTEVSDISILDGDTAIIPFNLRMGDTVLTRTNASLLCKIKDCYYFYVNDEETEPYFEFEGEAYENIVLLSKDLATHSYMTEKGLYITEKQMLFDGEKTYVLTSEECEVQLILADGEASYIEVKDIQNSPLNEKYLHVDFGGDTAKAYANGKLLTDWFSNGEEWVIALKRYGYPEKVDIEVTPFEEGIYYDLPPKKGQEIHNQYIEEEYIVEI